MALTRYDTSEPLALNNSMHHFWWQTKHKLVICAIWGQVWILESWIPGVGAYIVTFLFGVKSLLLTLH